MMLRRGRSSTALEASQGQDPRLPKWARLKLPQATTSGHENGTGNTGHQKPDDDAKIAQIYDDDDRHLRTLAYHDVSAQMEQAMQQALKDTVGAVFHRALSHLQQLSEAALVLSSDGNIDNGTSSTHSSSQRPTKKLKAANLNSEDEALETLDDEAFADLVSMFTLSRQSHLPAPADEEATSINEDDAEAVANAAKDPPILSSTTSYHRLLLPVLIVEGPFWPTDRSALNAFIVQSTRQSLPRCCVVSLSSSAATLKSMACLEILRQCLQQEPDVTLKRRHQERQRHIRKRHSNGAHVTDSLVWWAAHTRAFDSIMVFVHVDLGNQSYNSTKDSNSVLNLVQWMADRRAHQGLPLTLVLWNPFTHRRSLPFSSRLQSSVGLLVQSVTLPSADAVLNAWWSADEQTTPKKYSLSRIIPPAADSMVHGVRHSFEQQTGSVVSVVAQWRQHVAHVLAKPGSYASVMALLGGNDGEDTTATSMASPTSMHATIPPKRGNDSAKRITSLLYASRTTSCDDSSDGKQEFAAALKSDDQSSRMIPSNSRLIFSLVEWESYHQIRYMVTRLGYQVLQAASLPQEPILLFQRRREEEAAAEHKMLDKDTRLPLLAALHSLRNVVNSENAFTDSTFSRLDMLPADRAPLEKYVRQRTLMAIHQLIVLCDQCTTVSAALYCLEAILDNNCTETVAMSSLAIPQHAPQPRRDHVRALLDPPLLELEDESSSSKTIFRVPSCLYHTIRDRAGISEAEWYDAFVVTALDETSPFFCELPLDTATTTPTELFQWFVSGVRQLEVTGLVRRRRVHGKKGDNVMYDKTALVWCSGD